MMMKIKRLTKFFSEDLMLNIIESLCGILISVILIVAEIKTFSFHVVYLFGFVF